MTSNNKHDNASSENMYQAKGDSAAERPIVRLLRICMLIVLFILIIAPIAAMNRDPEAISEIDNRRLQALPELTWETATSNEDTSFYAELTRYVEDRIGFRSTMIGAYSALNDRVFGVMTHPYYEYGTDGWVYFRFSDKPYDSDFMVAFADYILEMQTYCEDRGIPFLYVISPEKARIYEEYIPDYVGSLPQSTDLLIPLLEERGINYIDQAEALLEAKDAGAQVFNKEYDAGHWNTEGMYAGSQAVIDALQNLGLPVEDIDIADYEKVYEHQTTLPASNYPIDVTTYKYTISQDAEYAANENADFNDGLIMDDVYRTAHYCTTDREDACTALMFQGSYYNTQGTMLQNQFDTLATVHDYENIFNLPYYLDIYQPDVVIFENADYTATDSYYSYDSLLSTKLPKRLSNYSEWPELASGSLESMVRGEGSSVASYYYELPSGMSGIDYSYVIANGKIYDAAKLSDGRFLWGAAATKLEGVTNVTVIGVDLEAQTKYSWTCPLSD